MKKSAGTLAPIVDPMDIEILPVVNSHTSQVCRMIHYCKTHQIKIVKEAGLEELSDAGFLA